jgi:hypothetical protein
MEAPPPEARQPLKVFATSAGTIKDEISDAVGKLNLQAGALAKSATEANRLARAVEDAANAADQQSQTSARQLEASQRPWVDADVQIGGPLFYNVNGANFTFVFNLRNSGPTPAFNTIVEPRMAVVFSDDRDPVEVRNELCSDARKQVKSSPLGVTLFPNVRFPNQQTVTIENQRMTAKTKTLEGIIDGPVLVSCIAYRSTFNATSVYTTSYIYRIRRINQNGVPVIVFPIGQDICADDLRPDLYYVSPITAD